MDDLKALKDWIKKNQHQFKSYKPEDIANLAIACGFKQTAVIQWEAEQIFQVIE